MLTFPRDLIVTPTVDWGLEAPPTDGGRTLGGVSRLVYLSGGPFWRLSLSLLMRGDDAILAGNALQGALLGGEPILVRPCDCRQTPLAEGASFGSAPVSDGSPFADVIAEESNPIIATVSAAALRATTLTLALSGNYRALVGGEQLAFDHANWGRRMYRVEAIPGGSAAAPVVRISPPLREAVTNGQAADFNRPGCVMQLAAPMDIAPDLVNRVHRGRLALVERPTRLT